jgi:hypothetical protein
MSASPDTPVQSCPKATPPCEGGEKDCNAITAEFGIGHVPPFVPLAAVKNALNAGDEEVWGDWFNTYVDPCSISKSVLDRLVRTYFGHNDNTEIKFTPPKLGEGLPAVGDPKSTYYKLEYLDDPVACADDNCRSKEAAEADIWGDFCPYIHTGENAGLYRHPHIALAALELWLAHDCNPDACPSTWLDSPNGKGYGADKMTSTSITWTEMDDNNDTMAQPAVPYKWPNSGKGLYPGHELYGDYMAKPAPGSYVTRFVAVASSSHSSKSSKMSKNGKGGKKCKSKKGKGGSKRV